VISAGKIMKSDEVRSELISLIDKKKSVFHGGISEIVKKEFELISQARECGASWTEIVDTLGFHGKEDGFTLAFWRERRRREKKREVIPQKPQEKGGPEKEKKSVTLIGENKKNPGGACEIFKSFRSID
jgi:hypothetical protein